MKHCGYDMLERKDPYDNFKPYWWCPQCGARKPKENTLTLSPPIGITINEDGTINCVPPWSLEELCTATGIDAWVNNKNELIVEQRSKQK